ncbi:hypothetical protein CC1G_10772 [Coprinopsis cinerea okayama7|uniref:Uncharacterized protein n=1 Tax=Coprinopsis cinerea (strain Okayama-7 / 130 / ATCC MYA-4618 / FGSC 9003) TaxID=240176 RepID=A8P3D9_COPC7|nr:hypothetical protein CC1G_10772 [Coprinopsis cinerea okayama7\|eukprot:XP_001838530.1 hypothetical protein CC1G_10772 [Coprinopsis cinerea okayama7\
MSTTQQQGPLSPRKALEALQFLLGHAGKWGPGDKNRQQKEALVETTLIVHRETGKSLTLEHLGKSVRAWFRTLNKDDSVLRNPNLVDPTVFQKPPYTTVTPPDVDLDDILRQITVWKQNNQPPGKTSTKEQSKVPATTGDVKKSKKKGDRGGGKSGGGEDGLKNNTKNKKSKGESSLVPTAPADSSGSALPSQPVKRKVGADTTESDDLAEATESAPTGISKKRKVVDAQGKRKVVDEGSDKIQPPADTRTKRTLSPIEEDDEPDPDSVSEVSDTAHQPKKRRVNPPQREIPPGFHKAPIACTSCTETGHECWIKRPKIGCHRCKDVLKKGKCSLSKRNRNPDPAGGSKAEETTEAVSTNSQTRETEDATRSRRVPEVPNVVDTSHQVTVGQDIGAGTAAGTSQVTPPVGIDAQPAAAEEIQATKGQIAAKGIVKETPIGVTPAPTKVDTKTRSHVSGSPVTTSASKDRRPQSSSLTAGPSSSIDTATNSNHDVTHSEPAGSAVPNAPSHEPPFVIPPASPTELLTDSVHSDLNALGLRVHQVESSVLENQSTLAALVKFADAHRHDATKMAGYERRLTSLESGLEKAHAALAAYRQELEDTNQRVRDQSTVIGQYRTALNLLLNVIQTTSHQPRYTTASSSHAPTNHVDPKAVEPSLTPGMFLPPRDSDTISLSSGHYSHQNSPQGGHLDAIAPIISQVEAHLMDLPPNLQSPTLKEASFRRWAAELGISSHQLSAFRDKPQAHTSSVGERGGKTAPTPSSDQSFRKSAMGTRSDSTSFSPRPSIHESSPGQRSHESKVPSPTPSFQPRPSDVDSKTTERSEPNESGSGCGVSNRPSTSVQSTHLHKSPASPDRTGATDTADAHGVHVDSSNGRSTVSRTSDGPKGTIESSTNLTTSCTAGDDTAKSTTDFSTVVSTPSTATKGTGNTGRKVESTAESSSNLSTVSTSGDGSTDTTTNPPPKCATDLPTVSTSSGDGSTDTTTNPPPKCATDLPTVSTSSGDGSTDTTTNPPPKCATDLPTVSTTSGDLPTVTTTSGDIPTVSTSGVRGTTAGNKEGDVPSSDAGNNQGRVGGPPDEDPVLRLVQDQGAVAGRGTVGPYTRRMSRRSVAQVQSTDTPSPHPDGILHPFSNVRSTLKQK